MAVNREGRCAIADQLHIFVFMKTSARWMTVLAWASLASPVLAAAWHKSAMKKPASEATYGVEYVPGGIDRVVLSKRDDRQNLCIRVVLASPAVAPIKLPGHLDLPEGWTLETAALVDDAAACRSRVPHPGASAVNATAISGSVRWGSSPAEKTAVDLTVEFPARGSQARTTEKLVFKR